MLVGAIRALLVLIFLYEGVSKWMGSHLWTTVFARIGFGDWFRYATGFIEVVGAVLLIRRATLRPGVAVLSVTMLGALLVHLTVLGVGPHTVVVALLLLALLLVGGLHHA